MRFAPVHSGETVSKNRDYAQECASHTCISLRKMLKCTFQAFMIASPTLVRCGMSFSFMPSRHRSNKLRNSQLSTTLMDWGTMFMSDVLFQDRLTHLIICYYPFHQGRPEGRGGKSGMGLDTNLGELLDGCLSCYGGAQALDHVRPFVLCAFLDIIFWVQAAQVVMQVAN